jgi:hypothetical protein
MWWQRAHQRLSSKIEEAPAGKDLIVALEASTLTHNAVQLPTHTTLMPWWIRLGYAAAKILLRCYDK